MRPEWIAAFYNGGIPLIGGIFATLLGYRIVGKRPGESKESDQWHAQFGPMFKWIGPAMIVVGILLLARVFFIEAP